MHAVFHHDMHASYLLYYWWNVIYQKSVILLLSVTILVHTYVFIVEYLLHYVEGLGLGQTDHLHQRPRDVLAGVAVVVEQQDLELETQQHVPRSEEP